MKLNEATARWRFETGQLPWGVQRAFYDALLDVKNNDGAMAYSADWRGSDGCLINATRNKLPKFTSMADPVQLYPEIVTLFDTINIALRNNGLNTERNIVSKEAAHYLLTNFGELKEIGKAPAKKHNEMLDDLAEAQEWVKLITQPA